MMILSKKIFTPGYHSKKGQQCKNKNWAVAISITLHEASSQSA